MIWGASVCFLFILLLILSLLQVFILRRAYRRNPPDCPLPLSVNAGERFSVPLEIPVPLLFPGFRILWKTSLIWEEGKRSLSASVSPGRKGRLTDLVFPLALRGLYRGVSGRLVLEDLFGFFSLPLYRGDPATLYVYPKLNGSDFEKDQVVSGGASATDDPARIRTDELLEVRKYYPGDDARRINWKMYASTGEMFLRKGEETPPPSGEAELCLFADSEAVASMSRASFYTDELIDGMLALIRRFAEKGSRVLIHISEKKPLVYDSEKPDKLLKVLAALSPESPPPGLPESEYLYVIAHPGSASLTGLPRKRKKETKIYLFSGRSAAWKSSLLKTLLIRNGEISSILAGKRERDRLEYLYNENVAYLQKEGRGKIHAGTL